MNPGEQTILPLEERPRRKNRFLRVIGGIVCIFFLLFISMLCFLFYYEKEIKARVIGELNKQLNVQVVVQPDDIDFTVWHTFPKAAVWFKHVTVLGSLPEVKNDTLLKAESIYLLFDLKDIWNKNYTIRRIRIDKARLNAMVNDAGETNYKIIKSVPGTATKESESFRLDEIIFNDFELYYKDYHSRSKCSADFKRIRFAGDFSNTVYTLDVSADGFVNYISVSKKNYVKNKNLSVELKAAVQKNNYTINKGEVHLNKLGFSVKGTFLNEEETFPCALEVEGKNVDIKSLLSLMPEKFHDRIKDYESTGNFYAKAKLEGDLKNYRQLAIESVFGIENASVEYLPLKATLDRLSLQGRFNKPKEGKELLSLQDVKLKHNENHAEGMCEIKDFSDPAVSFSAKGNYKLDDLFKFIKIDTLSSASGSVMFDVKAQLHPSDLLSKKNEAGTLSGEIALQDVAFNFKNGKAIRIEKGNILLNGEEVSTRDLKIMYRSSELSINGKANHLLNYIFKENQALQLDAEIGAPRVDLSDFIFSSAKKTSAQSAVSLSPFINARVKLSVLQMSFGKFTAKDFAGTLEIKNRRLLAQDISFEAFGGDVTLKGIADNSDTAYIKISSAVSLVDVDIRRMFTELENFGQDAILDKNISGRATAQVDFSAVWNNRLDCDLSSIAAEADITIEHGELTDYKPLESLSRYIELNELKRIKFSTLKTHVAIHNRLIEIGNTQIDNSALNVALSGTHSFNNDIDYRIKLLLGEYLAKKPGKNKQLDEELLENEIDPDLKRCVFLHMYGTVDKPIIKYDKKAARQKIKQDIKEEKKNLKKLLHEEFGLFKKDTSLNRKEENRKQRQQFKIEFGGNKGQEPRNEKRDEREKKPEPRGKKQESGEEEEDF